MTQPANKHIKKFSDIPLYEIIIRTVKGEMNKSVWIRDRVLISALKVIQSKFAKYWRKTGNFPDDNIAASILTDAIQDRKTTLKYCRESEIKLLENEIDILTQFLPETFNYKKLDFENIDPCHTNVRWKLYHNPENITITDKRQLRSIR